MRECYNHCDHGSRTGKTKSTNPQGVVMVTSVAGNSASASSARSLMARFEYLTKSSEEVEASLIFVNKSLCAFLEGEMTRFG